MSTFITFRRFLSEGNTGAKFGGIEYKSITPGGKGPDFEILVNDFYKIEDIKAAKEFLKFLFDVNSITDVYEISEEDAFGLNGEEERLKPKIFYEALRDGTLEDLDEEINCNSGT